MKKILNECGADMDSSTGYHSHISIICHDLERSYRGLYLLVVAVPFLVLGSYYLITCLPNADHGHDFTPSEFKVAVAFFSVTAAFVFMGVRILRFQYHLLLDRENGRFHYKKDYLLTTNRLDGDIRQIKEVSTRKVLALSDKALQPKRLIYEVSLRIAHQDAVVYMSVKKDEAHSMAQQLSGFLNVPLSTDTEEEES